MSSPPPLRLELFGQPLPPIAWPLLWGLAGVLAILSIGAVVAALLPRLRPGRDFSNLQQRVNSWWVMVALLAAALALGWQATLVLFALISFLALREFLSLAPARREDRLVILGCYLVVPISYAWIATDFYGIYLVFIPVWVFLITPFLMAVIGQTKNYLQRAAGFHWGEVACVYSIGFVVWLMRTPANLPMPAGPAGLVFLLLVATEANDVAQYCWGKLFGRHRIMPSVSPNKTWEGFLGGWATTALLICLIGPIFAPLDGVNLAIMAALLPLAGFAGDVTLSAVKRDIGVKDSSHLIPGHGGILDRIDSLTFTAPLYFHLMTFFALHR
ncbi:MAG TPA: phosphatidate cytidylyltransferase [Caulobacteraceae bacterium]|jgi:phosphatidate cytidylyltransferase|nr:phosphatidate cytidylyltransferase [Caulobacteraceae bacterium]